MVEAIGSLARLLGRTVQPTAPASAVSAAKSAVSGADEAQLAATGLASELSSAAPIDHARVAQLKAAIADGTYRIDADAVADRLLAAKREWSADGR